MEADGARTFRSMTTTGRRHWVGLAPITMDSDSASRYALPAGTEPEHRRAWCAGFDAARKAYQRKGATA